jgi:hypothetical protein
MKEGEIVHGCQDEAACVCWVRDVKAMVTGGGAT